MNIFMSFLKFSIALMNHKAWISFDCIHVWHSFLFFFELQNRNYLFSIYLKFFFRYRHIKNIHTSHVAISSSSSAILHHNEVENMYQQNISHVLSFVFTTFICLRIYYFFTMCLYLYFNRTIYFTFSFDLNFISVC
jgi:hypothetical protein